MKKDFYKRLLDSASDLIWAIDNEGRFLYINDNIKEWGYDKDELVGQPFLNILNTKHIGKRMTSQSDSGGAQSYEMEIVDKKGEAHKVIVKSSPLADEDGNLTGVMGVIRDVTETHLLADKLKNEERLASLGRLATGIAHEIRNPLSSVKMNLSILRDRLNPEGVDVEHFEIAQEEVDNLENIVLELLDYAKPVKLKLRRQNLHKGIEAAIATVEAERKEKEVTIKKEFAKNVPMALYDKGKIHQALLNVLQNAIQASERESLITIKTEYANSPSHSIKVFVIDNGKGIDPADMKFVFDPFFSTKKSGTGIGLAIVRSIMENHEGSVSIESEPGAGTTFCLNLPIR